MDLGLELEKKPVKPFVEFVVSTGKGPRKESERRKILQTAITDLERIKQSNENAITVFEATANSQQTVIAFRESEAKNQTVTSVLAVSISESISKPAITRLHVDDDGVIHGLDADLPSMSRHTASTRPTCHGTYRRLTANAVGLFSNLPGLSRSTEPQWPAFLPRPHLADVSPDGSKVIHPAGHAEQPSIGADLSHLTTIRLKDDDLAAGIWDADRGEFIAPVTPTGDTQTVSHVITSRTKSRAPAIAAEPGDSYVERDDFYQPDDFSIYEESPAWQD